MKHRIPGVVAAVALIAGTGVTLAPAAQADTKGCVTQKEFRQVKKGMTKRKVARIFDTKGTQDAISSAGGYTFEIRSYRACTQFGAVSIGFANGKLDVKSAIF